MKVAVVGGGVIGLCTALALRRAGAKVVVLERDVVGAGASSGNAGWITPGFSVPLPSPGVGRRTLRWLADPSGPARIRPRLDPSLAAWCWRFWRSSTGERYRAGIESLLGLNERTFELFDRLRADGVDVDVHGGGVVFAALTDRGLREEAHALADLEASGYRWPIVPLDAEAVHRLEPGLSPEVRGGFHAPNERFVRPEELLAALVDAFRASGGELREGHPVETLNRGRDGWRAGGDLRADRVVLAAGAWTGRLARLAGARIPLAAARGYSFTLPVDVGLRHALYLVEARVACTPFGAATRAAGMLDLAGLDARTPDARADGLRRSVSRYLADWPWEEAGLPWAGLRPLAPDGLPVIGALPGRDGLFVATGHGMLGITLAPATAELLAPVVLGERDGTGPFSPARFGRGRALSGAAARPSG